MENKLKKDKNYFRNKFTKLLEEFSNEVKESDVRFGVVAGFSAINKNDKEFSNTVAVLGDGVSVVNALIVMKDDEDYKRLNRIAKAFKNDVKVKKTKN